MIIDSLLPQSTTQFKFFDPHPGLAGCATPLPSPVVKNVAVLDQRVLTIEEAVQWIQKVIQGKGRLSVHDDCITWAVGTFKTGKSCWRLISFEEVDDESGYY